MHVGQIHKIHFRKSVGVSMNNPYSMIPVILGLNEWWMLQSLLTRLPLNLSEAVEKMWHELHFVDSVT